LESLAARQVQWQLPGRDLAFGPVFTHPNSLISNVWIGNSFRVNARMAWFQESFGFKNGETLVDTWSPLSQLRAYRMN
jgi:hypothetical protein